MSLTDKPIVWLSGEIKTPPFGPKARLEAGVLLRRLQRGESLSLPQCRPMPGIGRGCHELRVLDERVNWRIVYHVAAEAVVILAVFRKKTQVTPVQVIEDCQRRLSAFLAAMQQGRGR